MPGENPTATPAPAPAPEAPKSVSAQLLSDVAEAIATSTEAVKTNVKALFLKREIDDRVNVIDKVYEKLKNGRQALRKLKPDLGVGELDAEGKQLPLRWSKAKWEEKEKAEEQLQKLENLLNAALETPPKEKDAWAKLREAVSKKEGS